MNQHPNANDETYQENILQGVSRTFALTIPQLPRSLRRAVSNAYLLCRIADTIEDDNALSSERTRYFAEMFTSVVAGQIPAIKFSEQLYPLLSEHTMPDEHDLIKNTPAVIRITHSFNDVQKAALLRCVKIMAKGMADYQDSESLDGLPDLPAMDDYCYYVAGVVGEMLTELFCDYSPEIAKNRETLMKLAVSFGQGLQMTNILKDIWDDRARGACWLPRDIFLENGCDISRLGAGSHNEGFAEGLGDLLEVAKFHLENALQYTLLIPPHETGIRRFCLWALGMAVLTLNRINSRRDFTSGTQVKISRRSVKVTILTTNLLARHDQALKLLFQFASRNLPRTGFHEKIREIKIPGCN